jgi:hypothetical protein
MPPDVEINPVLLESASARELTALRQAAAALRTDSEPDEVVMDRPFYLYRKRVGDLIVVYMRAVVEGAPVMQIVGFQSR